MNKKRIVGHIALLLLLSLGATFFGATLSYQRFATPKTAWDLFSKIYLHDGWIEDGASINPTHLARRGNRMILDFHDWRPPGHGPARLRISVCGKLASEFTVRADRAETVYLTGECEPRTVSFEVVNPFVPSEKDQRKLGIQLKSMYITSDLRLPLLAPDLLLQVAGALFLCCLLFGLALYGQAAFCCIYLIPPASFFLLKNALYLRLDKVYPLWILACAVAVGFLIARYTNRQFLNKGPLRSSQAAGLSSPAFDAGSLLALLAVLTGALLRFYDLDFGLPANFHPDEVPKVNALMRMVQQETLDPQYFLHPSLLLYSTYFMNTLFHFLGMNGEFRDTAFLAGRTVSALAGTLSIYFVFVIGKRLYTSGVGIAAAFLLAVFPLHVACSRYLKEDALLLVFVLAAAVALLKAVQEDRKGFLFFSALLAGCSASTKYSGILTAGIVCLAPWLKSRSLVPDWKWVGYTCLAMLLVPLGFIICTPYAILNSTRFLRDFGHEKSHMERGHTLEITAWSQYWMYHFQRSIVPGMSFFATFLASLGVGVLLWRRKVEDLFLLAMLLLYYLPAEYVKAKPAPQPERYILPCLPFLAIAAGEGLRAIWNTRCRSLMPVVAALALVIPAQRSLEFTSEIGTDTRAQMARWMVEHLPRGAKIYFDWKPYEPRFFNDEFEEIYLPRDRIVPRLSLQNLQTSEDEYLLLSSLWYARYFTQPRTDAVVQHKIRQVFEQIPIVQEFRPKYGTYGFHNPVVTLFSLKDSDIQRLAEERRLKQAGRIEKTSNERKTCFKWW